METFEYKTISINLAEAPLNKPDSALDEYGCAGWQVVHAEPGIPPSIRIYLLMRRTGKNYGA
jgi:hypothetical protein